MNDNSVHPMPRAAAVATNFFQRQEKARRSTAWLLVMFCLATVAIVVTVMVVVAVVTGSATKLDANTLPLPILAGVGTLLLILGGSFFKVVSLRTVVARRWQKAWAACKFFPTRPIRLSGGC